MLLAVRGGESQQSNVSEQLHWIDETLVITVIGVSLNPKRLQRDVSALLLVCIASHCALNLVLYKTEAPTIDFLWQFTSRRSIFDWFYLISD